MQILKCLLPSLFLAVFFSSLSNAAADDRITGDLSAGQSVPVRGNVHGLARAEFDLGRADSNKIIHGVSLAFHPSAAQQQELDALIAHLQDPNSPDYHKFLTPAQFANRFGMSRSDIDRIVSWLQSEGFTNISVAHSRNQVSFDGTVAQIEVVFHTEIHAYIVNGETHFANANDPSVPAALAGSILGISHLHDFSLKPRAVVRPHLTSYVTGNHFISPGDYATIYHLQPLYSAGIDGLGQKIAIIGQSTVNPTDLSNFRSAAGLAPRSPTMILVPSTSTATRCAGDESESDLDLELSNGVARKASVTFVFAGLPSGQSCTSRNNDAWNALQYAVDNNVAPFISTSYGLCESLLGQKFSDTVQGWAQQAVVQGQTITAASGDSGAADCEASTSTSATTGLAVDVPAAIPEVTGAGGTEFTGDATATVSGTAPNTTAASTQYWNGSGTGSDLVSSALGYIPEEAWNDTKIDGTLSASGGGKSIYFTKPTWQTGTGVPADGQRDVPDIAFSASADHDPYLICSEDDPNGTIVSTCTSGFRTGAGGDFTAIGGTSVAAPTFSAILALLNQYFGNVPPGGLAPVNPTLYQLAASTPAAFHDITSPGNNFVPCTPGSTNCPATAPFQFGFNAGPGYDQVTGLGSVDGFALAQAWAATLSTFAISAAPASVVAGNSTTTSVTIAPQNSFTGTVTFSCPSSGLPAGVTCAGFNPTSVSGGSGSTTLTLQTAASLAAGTISVTVNGTSGTFTHPTAVNLTTSPTNQTFTLAASAKNYQVSQGGSVIATVNLNGTNGFNTPVTYTCTDTASESTCIGPTGAVSASTAATFNITARAPVARLQSPFDRGRRIFYATLLPGLLGIMFAGGSRTRSMRGMRLLGLIAALGFSALWLGSCGGSSNSSNTDPGTPTGTYTITVNATTGGANPITAQTTFNLVVVQ